MIRALFFFSMLVIIASCKKEAPPAPPTPAAPDLTVAWVGRFSFTESYQYNNGTPSYYQYVDSVRKVSATEISIPHWGGTRTICTLDSQGQGTYVPGIFMLSLSADSTNVQYFRNDTYHTQANTVISESSYITGYRQ